MTATYIGTVVGAGFASGQEIWSFFARFGRWGYLGLCLAGLVFAVFGCWAFGLGRDLGPKATQYQVLVTVLGRWAAFFDLLLLFFLIVLTGVMLAGAGRLAEVHGYPFYRGMFITASLALAVIAADLTGLVMVNGICVPFLLLCTLLVAGKSLFLSPRWAVTPVSRNLWPWPVAAMLYAAYNTALAFPVLVRLGGREPDPYLHRLAGLGGAVGLTFLGGLMAATLIRHADLATRHELPMPALAARLGRGWGELYGLVLWAELFTTLVADLYAASLRLHQAWRGRPIFWAAGVMAVGTVLARFGFARLIRTVYPAFGLFSLFLLYGLYKTKKYK